MAQDSRAAVLGVEELVHEHVHCCPERIQREVSHVLRERKQSERAAEGEVGKRGLSPHILHDKHGTKERTAIRLATSNRNITERSGRTSTAIPGMNMTTASAWKNLRRAFTLSVGTCLSAASSRSVATFEKFAPLGRSGRLGRLGKLGSLRPSIPSPVPVGVAGTLGSLSSTGASCGLPPGWPGVTIEPFCAATVCVVVAP